MQTKLMALGLFIAALSVLVQAAETASNIQARESGGQQLSIELAFDEARPAQTTGRFTTVKGSCAGTLALTGKTRTNDFLFEENVESGACVKKCKLVVDAAFQTYKENCPRNVRSEGRFDTVEMDDGLRQRIAARFAAPATAAATKAPDGVYRAENFSGVKVWQDAFDKMAHDKPGFEAVLKRIGASATGTNAKVNGLVGGANRNSMQKFLTDLQVHRLYERDPQALFDKSKQCTEARDYSAAEACDCAAGFPGDAAIGAGAGELVVQSNKVLIIKACGVAADEAQAPRDKGRYLAQRARAQILTNDQSKAVPWIAEATSLGYTRASIVLAQAQVVEMEVRSGGFPPPSNQQYKDMLKQFAAALAKAQANKVRETAVVADQMEEVFDRLKFNNAVLQPIYREMVKPVPRDNCEPEYGKIGVEADGRPMIGMRNPCRRQ